MIANDEELEVQLVRLGRRFEKVSEGTFLIALGGAAPPAALRLADPVWVVQVEIGAAPAGDAAGAKLLRRLLELNASDLIHAAYGIQGDSITLNAALELARLDLNELEAVLADVDLAIAEHVPALRALI